MNNYDYSQMMLRGFEEEVYQVIDFIEKETKRGWGDGYEFWKSGDGLCDLELRAVEIGAQIIQQFPLVRITGLCEQWENLNHCVMSFYSESGEDTAHYDFAGYFDANSDGGAGRWAWDCDMFLGCKGSFTYVQTGMRERYNYTYPYTKKWWGNTFLRNVDGQNVKVRVRYDGAMTHRFVTEQHVLKKYFGPGGEVCIPDMIIEIAANAFDGCELLTAVTIPASVTVVGKNAFRGCTKLKTVTVCGKMELDYKAVFKDCKKLVDINDPYNNPPAKEPAKSKTSKAKQTLVTEGNPNTLTAAELKKLWVSQKLPDGTLRLTKYKGKATDIQIPACIGKTAVTAIGDKSFLNSKKITSVTIPEGITAIGERAFSGCKALASVSLPDSLVTVGEKAFHGCPALADDQGFVVLNNVLYYYSGAGGDVVIPQGITTISADAFTGNKDITSVILPESVDTIGDNAFCGCSKLSTVTLPREIPHMGEFVFNSCPRLADENGFVIVQNRLYNYCGRKQEIVVPETVTLIEGTAFGFTNPPNRIALSEKVEHINRNPFEWLSKVTLVVSEGSYAHQYAQEKGVPFTLE